MKRIIIKVGLVALAQGAYTNMLSAGEPITSGIINEMHTSEFKPMKANVTAYSGEQYVMDNNTKKADHAADRNHKGQKIKNRMHQKFGNKMPNKPVMTRGSLSL